MEIKKEEFEQAEDPYPSSIFRKTYYKEITDNQWNDYKWQLDNRITTKEQLKKFLILDIDEIKAFEKNPDIRFSITPYYMSLVKYSKELRKCVIPNINEFIYSNFESEDPLGEEKTNPVKCIIHRYPDRCLFLVSDFCSSKCRYCTRSRIIEQDNSFCDKENWKQGIEYIKQHKEIRDVVISGGDPLTYSHSILRNILVDLNKINHVKIIRIGTKVPVVLPQRIDEDLLEMLNLFWKKLYINIHVTHPKELTQETKEACLFLAKLGIPLGSQTVLLKGVNDNVETMKNLMQGLLECKVIPRYLYSMDRIKGSSHFFVDIEKGKEIIRGIRGFTSGMACPTYVIDSENGKIPVDIGYTEKLSDSQYRLTNYEGKNLIYNY